MEYATGQQLYDVTIPASESPISVSELKLFAKISGTSEDALLQQIINGVTLEAERYTKLDFVSRTYKTFRDSFGDYAESPAYVCNPPMRYRYSSNNAPIVLRRSPLQSVSLIQYYSGGVLTTLNVADYMIVRKPAFSFVVPVGDALWPTPDDRMQAVQITFVSGFGAAAAVPADIKNALLAHATSVYQNRGDCNSGSSSCACEFAPAVSLAVYNQRRIVDFVL